MKHVTEISKNKIKETESGDKINSAVGVKSVKPHHGNSFIIIIAFSLFRIKLDGAIQHYLFCRGKCKWSIVLLVEPRHNLEDQMIHEILMNHKFAVWIKALTLCFWKGVWKVNFLLWHEFLKPCALLLITFSKIIKINQIFSRSMWFSTLTKQNNVSYHCTIREK